MSKFTADRETEHMDMPHPEHVEYWTEQFGMTVETLKSPSHVPPQTGPLHQDRPETLGATTGRVMLPLERTPMLQSKSEDSPEGLIPKVISPTAHGIIDYCHAAFFFTVGVFCARSHNKAASRAAFATGSFIIVQSLLTDYRFGFKPVLSFETHGKMDAVFASSSWMVPLLFGFKGTAAAKIFESNSLAEASVVALTDWNSQRAHEERQAA